MGKFDWTNFIDNLWDRENSLGKKGIEGKGGFSNCANKIITFLTLPLGFLFVPVIGAIVWLLSLDSDSNKLDEVEKKTEKDWEEALKDTIFGSDVDC